MAWNEQAQACMWVDMCSQAAAQASTGAFAWRRGPPSYRLNDLSLQICGPEQHQAGGRDVRWWGLGVWGG